MQDKLIELSDVCLENYKAVLNKLGYKTKTSKIKVDKRGFSPEIANLFGQDYLRNNIIIVSIQQKDCSLINQEYSFLEKLLNKTYSKNSSLIEKVTLQEPIVGNFNIIMNNENGSTNLINYFNALNNKEGKISLPYEKQQKKKIPLHITFTADTLNGSFKKVDNINKEINRIDSNDKLILNNKYLDKILEEIIELKQKYKNIKKMRFKKVSLRLSSFKFSDGGYDIYVFGYKSPFIVYSGKKHEVDNIDVISISNEEKILDILFHLGFLEFDSKLGVDRRRQIDKDIFSKHGYKLVWEPEVIEKNYEKTVIGGTFEYHKLMEKKYISNEFPNYKDWYRLRDLTDVSEKDYRRKISEDEKFRAFEQLSLDSKFRTAKILSKDKYVNEVFNRIKNLEK